jgi:putative DNA primase/helicase
MDAQKILDRFQNVSEEHDGGYLASCTAHNDSRPSLRIWFDDSRCRMTCRAGCDTADVIKAAGLRWSALFNVSAGEIKAVPAEPSKPVGPGEIAALRMWLDSLSLGQEHITYLNDRFGMSAAAASVLGVEGSDAGEGFTHTSRSFDAHPRIVIPLYDFNGVARGVQGRDISGDCPNRWMSLTNPDGKHWQRYGYLPVCDGGTGPVILTEGPSDSLTAVAAGYSALLIRGASLASSASLLAEIAQGLSGRRVFVAGDNDPAGDKFSTTVANALAAHDIDVYRIRIPIKGGDLTDWRNSSPGTFASQLFTAMKGAEKVTTAPAIPQQTTGAVPPSSDEAQEASRIVKDLSPRYGVSDVMRAHALVEFTGNRVRYSSSMGFFVWNGTVWERSDSKVRALIHQLGAALNTRGLELNESTKDGYHYKAAAGCTSSRSIDAILTELKSVPGVAIKASELDSQPDLLNFQNGTVDLRTGELRPHSPDDLLTVALDYDYDPDAKAPRWESFLEEIMPDHPEMPAYLQRLVGYGITGHTSEQCFAVLHGKGANGKSIFTDTLTKAFGEITRTTPFSTFEERSSGGIPNDIASLHGARLVMASEGEAGRQMSESVIKSVTGDQHITARFLRKEFFTFRPTFLILLATNHKPRFKSQDTGLWRRVKLIPFSRYLAPHERDYDLDKKVAAEAQGIVAWAVRGAVEWYKGGLNDPDVIVNATKEYRETSDALAGFIGDVVEITGKDDDRIVGKDLFNAYLDWCSAENLPDREKWRRNTFFSAIEERGVSKRRVSAGMAFFGIRMVEHAAPEQEDSGELFL